MKVVQSRKISVMAGALAILIILMNFRIPAALAETWSFVDGNGTTGLNYDVSKAASTPYMVNFGGSLYVTWAESSGTNGQIRVKKYDSDSGTWSTADNDTPLNVNAAKDAQNPTLAVLGGTLYAAWQEAGSPYWQVRVKKLTATGWVSVDGDGAGGLNYNTSNNARNAKLAAYNGSLYLLWDEALGSGITQMRVKKV
ncbi:hypothetical protein [Cohnella rhizosphaerae]|uniref:Uncharacterized protein n=1 Tax=Cohnella rhizosphaerae TaxID=1457232 RepID=A0A9X4QXY2_9BACL|nr:hypothetical protein [Cohnella rhizosphaerae]MDG0814047.1 hypothetical protein [Cohnella rhizosphaerae]